MDETKRAIDYLQWLMGIYQINLDEARKEEVRVQWQERVRYISLAIDALEKEIA